MKFVHLSDLHLGKRVNGFSMVEDQQYILEQILALVAQVRPDGALLAGDLYDKAVPSAEAVALLDDFLVRLSRLCEVFLISGNHDSPERMAFGGRLMEQSGVFVSPVYSGAVTPLTRQDAFGPVQLYLLPFVKPAHVRRCFPDLEINSYNDALAAVLSAMEVDPTQRNILVTHQFVTGAAPCDGEDLSVGGTDQVDGALFDAFDYVALGHLHSPQAVGRESLRYCGSPLKYSFSEARQEKSLTVVELGPKGQVSVSALPLRPLRDMVELRGSYEALTYRGFYQGTAYPESYVHITLTDEEDIPDAVRKLQVIYPYLMKLTYDNRRTQAAGLGEDWEADEQQSPLELLEAFYAAQNGSVMDDAQRAYAQALLETLEEAERCGH